MQKRHSIRALATCVQVVSWLLFLAPDCLAQQADTGSIIGQVRVTRGGFLPEHIAVNLATRGANVNTSYTDDEGRFAFYQLAPNLYHVSVAEKDYLPVVQDAALKGGMTINLEIELIPGNGNAASSSQVVSGGNSYMASIEGYAKHFPPKVLKEFEAGVKADGKAQSDDAIAHYRKALDLAPDFYPARNNLGSDYLSQGNFPAAQKEFEQVIKGTPDDAAAYFNLGNTFLISKRYEDAGRFLKEGLKKEPTSAIGVFLLGSLQQQTRQYVEAEKDLRRALELDPHLTKAHLALVNLYMQQQRSTEASDELKLFLKVAPNDAFAPKARVVLKKLEEQPVPNAAKR